MRAGGADLVDRWRGLSAVYEAPEAPALLDGILPVEPAAARYADALAQVATAVREYADTIRPVQRTLTGLRDDARSFRDRAAARERWDGDQDLVDENTRLVHAVGVQQSLLDEAARQCALRIRAATRGDSALRECTPDGLHVSRATTLPAGDQPWGHVVRRHDPCPKSAAVQVKHFLWDGIAVDSVWAGVAGSAGYYGLDTTTWEFSLATARTTWASMPDIFRADEHGSDVRYEAAKSLLAWDTWSEDPARAAGSVAFTFLPGAIGAAGTALKGSRAAGMLGRTGSLVRELEQRPVVPDTTHAPATVAASVLDGAVQAPERLVGSVRLTVLPDGTFRSPGGLIYGPDPHFDSRVEHVLNHATDQPQRSKHGVFTEDPLAATDEAWAIARRGPVVSFTNGDRTSYYVNMQRDVGYVGGEPGSTAGHPKVSYMVLGIENGNHVITSFPVSGIPMGGK
ncbi:hypothetical protein [Cellulomonas septica]|uniref:Bacterial CdiA-CT RNAse A domain-containing protein n=1 Tax=Cellulomonas septica TaxID=285080 RepID=A0ABX1JZ65_9CELL|nr:hypothetical protein [Cellulomonas septica]NKY39211.1 hypothetical protein [Cellulomonas septica]